MWVAKESKVRERERDLLLPGDGEFLTVILKEDRVAVS